MIAIQPQTTYALTVPPGPLTAAELRELVALGAKLLGMERPVVVEGGRE